MKPEERKRDLYFLKLLSRSFPNVATASTEIINLEAILNLPKGTEHFLADLHGEYLAFQHVLRNASGTIKRKVEDLFKNSMRPSEQQDLCTLIYYPSEKLELVKGKLTNLEDLNAWYYVTINQLIMVCRNVSSKYSRSKVHKALPPDFSYIIQELMHESSDDHNKEAYVEVIIRTIISTGRVEEFIIAVCNLIQQLTIDMLHLLGDVYDRGPSPDKIMDILCGFHNFDIQWGNHDILWMGAAAGNDCSIANVLRIALRYGNHGVLEDGYGINLLPLATFAIDTYAGDPCERFLPKDGSAKDPERARTAQLVAQMHKAISIIQFKLEAATIKRRPDFGMKDRLLLDKMDLKKGIIKIAGKEYELLDTNFPTVDPKHPYKLTPEEESIVNKLHQSFTESEKLRKHMLCMFRNGCLYAIANGNLLYHASIPLNDDGTLKDVSIRGEKFHGKALLKRAGNLIRSAYFGCDDPEEREFALDYLWYLWCGKDSPAFDKSKMATFERYFIADKETHKEVKGAYYAMRDNPEVVDRILDEFGVTGEHRHIINGHVPVKTIKGENPIKAGGKLMVIDGGFSKAYQPETGIAGYTLVYHSRGFELVQHEPFSSIDEAVRLGQDIKSRRTLVEKTNDRMYVKDTDIGEELRSQIEDLKELLDAYRSGDIKERTLHPITNKR